MKIAQQLQQHLNLLAGKIQNVILQNEQKKYAEQAKQERSISSNKNEEDIIPHSSYICSLEFEQNLRQFILLNQACKIDCPLKIQPQAKRLKHQNIQPQMQCAKYYRMKIMEQRLYQQSRENNNTRQFIDWPNIFQSQMFEISLPYKDKKIQIRSQDLLSLKDRKMIAERIVSNFFTILKQSGRINERTEIFTFAFIPTLLQGVDQNQQSQENIIQAVKKNYEQASKCLKLSILQKTFAVIPFVIYDHYSMVIIKGMPKLLTKKDQKATLLYCSSRFIADKNILLAIKTYLQIEIQLTYGKGVKINEKNLECTQLILSKQVYSADSGLFLMLYCETLLADTGKELDEVKTKTSNYAPKFHLFSLNLIEQLRAIIWNFYYNLINVREIEQKAIIEEYFAERKRYEEKADLQYDYSTLNDLDVKKLQILMNNHCCQSEKQKYELILEAYYHPNLNYYVSQ